MIDCEAYSEDTISLKRIRQPEDRGAKSGTEWASLVMDVMDKLKDVFVPLTADLLLYCYYKDGGSEDWDVEPSKPSWHLREFDIPKKIYAAPGFNQKIAPTVISEVPQINKEAVVTWVDNALRQKSPRPDIDFVDVDSLDFRAVRAKILNDRQFQGRDTFVVNYFRMGRYEFPLRRINGELWVYSPLPEVFTKPSFKVRTSRYTGAFDIDIFWFWWLENSLEDIQALEQALINVVNTGLWKLTFISQYMKMPRLKTYAEKVGSDKY